MTRGARMLGVLVACWLAAGLLALALPAGAEPRSLHKRLDPAVQCSHCHSTDTWAFDWKRSDGAPFDHGWTGFPLLGGHARAACLDCHEREPRPSRACTTCHDDEHDGRLGQDCDRCHNANAFSEVMPLTAHRNARLPLSGMHALIECNACHVETTRGRSDAPPSDCFACHQQDYELHTNHPRHFDPRGGGSALPTDCRHCHSTLAWSPARLPRELAASAAPLRAEVAGGALASPPMALSRRQHERYFPILLGSHAQADCSDCHGHGGSPAASPPTCTGCHTHGEAQLRRDHASVALPASRSFAVCMTCHVRGARR